jgi:Bacterial surface proteins containing Ig-like domains
VEVGKTIPLLAVLEPDGADRTVTWLSSDTAVASVAHGQVTGVSPGTAVITVFTSKDNVKVSKTITVVPAGSLGGTDSAVSAVSSEVSSAFVLPAVSAVGQGDIYSGVEVVPPSSRASILGLIAWVCIILGVVIVLLVLFSGKRSNTGLPGKKRYHRRSAGGHKKRLLDDRYYRNYRKK